MKRDLNRLSENKFDVLVIGGGIYGIFVAWDAALRGLSVALVDKGDFGHATSFNTLRLIHGGFRYLQSLDIRRARQSIYEQTVFMRIAPHLIKPLPVLIPAYGHFSRGKEILSLALKMYNLISFDRNRLRLSQDTIPLGSTLSRDECIKAIPDIEQNGLTGGIIFYDCQISSSERLIISLARSAYTAGAVLANYAEVKGFVREKNRIAGVLVKDVINGDEFEIQAKIVVNTSGPWLNRVLGYLNKNNHILNQGLSKAFNILINRRITTNYAFGIYSESQNKQSAKLLGKRSRYFFITPWQDRSLIGTAHLPYYGDPDRFQVTKDEVKAFLDEINSAYPSSKIELLDVCFAYGGYLPTNISRAGTLQLSTDYSIYDHGTDQDLEGLVSVSGVKFTEARLVAERVVDLVFRKFGKTTPISYTRMTPVHGGDIEHISDFISIETKKRNSMSKPEMICDLINYYGSSYSEILKYVNGASDSNGRVIERSSLIRAEIIHGIRDEAAQKLSDVIFRRTNLCIDVNTKDDSLKNYAEIMAKELKWDQKRIDQELEDTIGTLSSFTLNA